MRSSTLSLFSSLLLACLVGGQSQWTRPPAVMTGDAIRIVATGGAVSAASLSSGVSYLNSTYGLLVRQDDTVLSVDLYYAGSDTTRASGVLQALSEPDTKVVWAARGGYGTVRLLDLPDFNNIVATSLASAPKWLIGYSDVTALHALWNRAGVLSIYGPMGSDISAFSQVARDSLFKVIGSGNAVTQTFNGTIRYRGRSSDRTAGRLLGGNLSVLASMVGSGFLPSYAGAILFVEDTGEAPYRLDRMLTQLLRADEFQGIVAIAIGQLLGADTSSYTALELLDRTLGSLGLPIITGLSIGHNTTTSLPIVLGALAEVDSNLGQLRVSVPAVSNLANSSKQGF